jgi:hypothetical protein
MHRPTAVDVGGQHRGVVGVGRVGLKYSVAGAPGTLLSRFLAQQQRAYSDELHPDEAAETDVGLCPVCHSLLAWHEQAFAARPSLLPAGTEADVVPASLSVPAATFAFAVGYCMQPIASPRSPSSGAACTKSGAPPRASCSASSSTALTTATGGLLPRGRTTCRLPPLPPRQWRPPGRGRTSWNLADSGSGKAPST